MLFKMNKIGRTVELDDNIVKMYQKTIGSGVITEHPFIISLKADFGHYPDETEFSDKELSEYCNNVLLQEIPFVLRHTERIAAPA